MEAMSKTRKLRLQRKFNKAYKGLASQGFEKSVRGADDMCAYRGRGKTRCAIGWLIPDELYKKSFEGCAADESKVLEAAGFEEDDFLFANDLQDAHDRSITPNEIKEALQRFARNWELTVPKIAA